MKKKLNRKPTFKLGFTIIILFSILTIISCNKDEPIDLCGDEYVGKFNLLESSRNSIPYMEDTSLLFQDSAGSQVVFEFVYGDGGYGPVSISNQTPCEFDSSKEKVKYADGDIYQFDMNETTKTLDLKFKLRLSVYPFVYDSILVSDKLGISINDNASSTAYIGTLLILVDERDLTEALINDYPKPIEEITLIGKTFFNVYTNADYSFYYNYELGIIAFKDKDNNLWVLE